MCRSRSYESSYARRRLLAPEAWQSSEAVACLLPDQIALLQHPHENTPWHPPTLIGPSLGRAAARASPPTAWVTSVTRVLLAVTLAWGPNNTSKLRRHGRRSPLRVRYHFHDELGYQLPRQPGTTCGLALLPAGPEAPASLLLVPGMPAARTKSIAAWERQLAPLAALRLPPAYLPNSVLCVRIDPELSIACDR